MKSWLLKGNTKLQLSSMQEEEDAPVSLKEVDQTLRAESEAKQEMQQM